MKKCQTIKLRLLKEACWEADNMPILQYIKKKRKFIIYIVLFCVVITGIRFVIHKVQEYRDEISINTDPAYLLDRKSYRMFDFKTGESVRILYSFESDKDNEERLRKHNYGFELYNKSEQVVYILKGINCPRYNLNATMFPELENRCIPVDSGVFFALTTSDIRAANYGVYFSYENNKYSISPSFDYTHILMLINGTQKEVAIRRINDSTIALTDLYDTRTLYRELPFDIDKDYFSSYELIGNKLMVKYTEIVHTEESGRYEEEKSLVLDIDKDCIQETKDMMDPRTKYALNTQGQADVTKEYFDSLMPHEMYLQELMLRYDNKLHLLKENTINESYSISLSQEPVNETNNYKEYAMSGEDFVMFLIFKNDMLNTCEYVLLSNFD